MLLYRSTSKVLIIILPSLEEQVLNSIAKPKTLLNLSNKTVCKRLDNDKKKVKCLSKDVKKQVNLPVFSPHYPFVC